MSERLMNGENRFYLNEYPDDGEAMRSNSFVSQMGLIRFRNRRIITRIDWRLDAEDQQNRITNLYMNLRGVSSVRGSASELLAAQLLSLPEGMDLRLAGHSLGSPLVIAAAEQVLKRRPEAFGIRRIALLDPYWSRQMPLLNPQDYLPLKTTAEESLERAQKLAKRDVLFEIYYSCPVLTQLPLLADDSPARALLSSEMAVMVCYDASFAELDFEAQHLLAPCLYLHSMRFAAGPVPSARSSTAQLRSCLGRCF
eukprot:s140_g13.t1